MNHQQSQGNQSAGRQQTWDGRSSPSYTQRISQRMTRDEAVKAVVRMMSAYPTFRCSEESMVALAEVLLSFPLETAMAASSPIHGAARKHKDYPLTAGQLTEWCEMDAEHLYEHARMERGRLPAPAIQRPTQAELDAQFQRLGLSHLRPGSKFHVRPQRFSADERREAQAILDRYAAKAASTTAQQREPAQEAAE